MAIRQISVFIENKTHSLGTVLNILKENGINLRAMSIADTRDFGILRLIVNDTDKACDVLAKADYALNVSEVIAVSIPDKTGALSYVLDILGENKVNIEYLYVFITGQEQVSIVIRVDNNDRAAKALSSGGVRQLTENDIASM